MEFNTIANNDVFGKIEQLGHIAYKYKNIMEKAIVELKNQI